MGIMREGDSIAVRIMLDLEVNPTKLYSDIVKVLGEYENGDQREKKHSSKKNGGSYGATPNLNQFGTDLTKEALDGKIDPVIRKRRRNGKDCTNII